jgi:hypothetical protein
VIIPLAWKVCATGGAGVSDEQAASDAAANVNDRQAIDFFSAVKALSDIGGDGQVRVPLNVNE